jgi:hypothetical protein
MYYPKGSSDYTLLRFVPAALKTYADLTVTTEKISYKNSKDENNGKK